MKAYLILPLLFFIMTKGYGQLKEDTHMIDSLVRHINSRRNLASKAINDTTYLSYPNGTKAMGHYFTLKYYYQKEEPKLLIKAVEDKITYYYFQNELIKVEDRTETPIALYFNKGNVLYPNVSKMNAHVLARLHQENSQRFLNKFLSRN